MGMFRQFCTTALALAVATTVAAQQGHKETDRLIKRANDTIKEIGVAKAQLQKTVGYYNAIMKGGSGDTRKIYKDLENAIKDTDKRALEVGKKVEEMEAEAHTFFGEWTTSVQQISSEDLKKRSQARLNETRVAFSEILAAGRRAGAEFDPFIGELKDQVVYLGYDLNPSAVGSLAEDAKKLNAHAATLYSRIDDVSKLAGEYVLALKPE